MNVYSFLALSMFAILGFMMVSVIGTIPECGPLKTSSALVLMAMFSAFYFLGRAAGKEEAVK